MFRVVQVNMNYYAILIYLCENKLLIVNSVLPIPLQIAII